MSKRLPDRLADQAKLFTKAKSRNTKNFTNVKLGRLFLTTIVPEFEHSLQEQGTELEGFRLRRQKPPITRCTRILSQ